MKANVHLFLLLLGCGAQQNNASVAQAPSEEGSANTESASRQREEVSVSAEMGALNPQQTHSSFYNAMDGVQECVTAGTQRLPFLSGEVELALLIDTSGQPLRVWSKRSSLGDRATEQCMFRALMAVTWPPSLGGPVSIASNRFEFPIAKGVSSPSSWDAGRAGQAMEPLEEELEACGAIAGTRPTLTLYIDADGHVISAGAGHERRVSDASIDCILSVVQGAQFPSTDPSLAKLRFRL